MSKGSAHFQNEQLKAEKTGKRIAQMQQKLVALKQHWQSQPQLEVAALADTRRKLLELESHRDLKRWWIHLDLDMFYAAAELLTQPELRDQPVAVGGLGMITTSNYVARRFGVRAAQPGFIGIKLCPHLQFVKPDFKKYTAIAEQVRAVFREYDENFQAASLDEAYLDITPYLRQHKDEYLTPDYTVEPMPDFLPVLGVASGAESFFEAEGITPNDDQQLALAAFRIAAEMRRKVYKITGLTASAGIGPNRLLAKICSDRNKPNGQCCLYADADLIRAFMHQLNVRKVSGIGKVMERILNELGATVCSDVTKPELAMLIYELFSTQTAEWILLTNLGISGNRHTSAEDAKRKSISSERTFAEINKWDEIEAKVRDIATSLAVDIADHKCEGKCVTLKLKTTAFTVTQRSLTLSRYIHTADDVVKTALQILKEEYDKLELQRSNQLKEMVEGSTAEQEKIKAEPVMRLRLVGIKLSTLKDTSASNTLDAFVSKKAGAERIDNEQSQSKDAIDWMTNQSLDGLGGNEQSLDSEIEAGWRVAKRAMSAQQSAATKPPAPRASSPIVCPICNRHFDHETSHDLINTHMDRCIDSYNQPAASSTATNKQRNNKTAKSALGKESMTAFVQKLQQQKAASAQPTIHTPNASITPSPPLHSSAATLKSPPSGSAGFSVESIDLDDFFHIPNE